MRRLLLTLVLLVLPLSAAAQDGPGAANPPNVVVRQSADPATGAVVGQRVALYVDVFFRDAMPWPPRVSLPDVPGLQNFRFETQGLTERETIAGADYVGQRFEFALYARRGGAFELPPAMVTLLDRQGAETGRAQGGSVHLEVIVPPGVDLSQPVVATRRFTLSEQWAPDPKGPFKPGDAIVRTITRTADDVPGLAMRDLAFSAPEGIRTYADPPEIDDHSERGVVTGRRMDRVTYVFERGGGFVLPAVTQPWWDLSASALKRGDAIGATIDVSAAPAAGSVGKMAGSVPLVLVVGAALLVALALGFVLRHRRRERNDAEREAFASLRRACATADAAAAYRAFTHWRRFLPPERQAEASQAAAPLDAALFVVRPSTWGLANPAEFVEELVNIRHKLHSTTIRDIPLPPLNP